MSEKDFIEPGSGRTPLTNVDQPTLAEIPGTEAGADPAHLRLNGVPGGRAQPAQTASYESATSGQGAGSHANVEEGERYEANSEG
jgi:hypothetical protein